MAKRKPSFLSRKKLLSEDQYEEYKRLKETSQTKRYKEEIEDLKRKGRKTSKVSSFIGGAFSVLGERRGGARALYRGSAKRTGQVGRPKGSVKYRDERGNPIGVYEYRKLLANRLRQQRYNQDANQRLSPREINAIRTIRERNFAQSLDPERRTIPSTSGNVPMNNIMEEIDIASNLVD